MKIGDTITVNDVKGIIVDVRVGTVKVRIGEPPDHYFVVIPAEPVVTLSEEEEICD